MNDMYQMESSLKAATEGPREFSPFTAVPRKIGCDQDVLKLKHQTISVVAPPPLRFRWT